MLFQWYSVLTINRAEFSILSGPLYIEKLKVGPQVTQTFKENKKGFESSGVGITPWHQTRNERINHFTFMVQT